MPRGLILDRVAILNQLNHDSDGVNQELQAKEADDQILTLFPGLQVLLNVATLLSEYCQNCGKSHIAPQIGQLTHLVSLVNE